jgi:hypothetical protein
VANHKDGGRPVKKKKKKNLRKKKEAIDAGSKIFPGQKGVFLG